MRLFIAIHFSEKVKGVLLDAIGELRSQSISGNFTRPENLHLTLAFIGESENLPAIKTVMNQAALSPRFNMTIGGFGHFGNLYWVGIEKNPFLSDLAGNLQENLRQAGFPIEKRPFKPHITIGREVVPRGPLEISVPQTAMVADRISLMKSERLNGKLTYTEVYGKALQP